MADALAKAEVSVESVEVTDVGHDLNAIWTPAVREQVSVFFRRNLLDAPTTRPALSNRSST